MPPRKHTTPFKAPRQATEKGTTRVGVGHRKDNAEWGKRMERQLGQIEKRQKSIETRQDSSEDDVPIVNQIETESTRKGKGIKMMSEREAVETAKFGEVLRWSTDSDSEAVPSNDTILSKTNQEESVKHKDVGMKIARDFGKKGVFLGQVVAVEYDSEDVDKNEDIFVVEYTDGDREDMNKEELVYANEFYIQLSGIDDDTPEGSLHTESGESESYKPSPPVSILCVVSIIPTSLIRPLHQM
jgi:hypothetical protein